MGLKLRYVALICAVSASALTAQSLPWWEKGLTAEQSRVYRANLLELARVNRLESTELNAVSEIVGVSFRTRGFLAALSELKSKAATAGKLRDQITRMESIGRSLPGAPLRTESTDLINRASTLLSLGRLNEAETVLNSLVLSRWGASAEERNLLQESILASANLREIRYGKTAAADYIAAARASAKANWIKADTQLLVQQADLLYSDCIQQARRQSCEAGLEALSSSLKSISRTASPAEWATLRNLMGEACSGLATWERAKFDTAKIYFEESATVARDSADKKLLFRIYRNLVIEDVHVGNYDSAVASGVKFLSFVDKTQYPDEWAALSSTLGFAYAVSAQTSAVKDNRWRGLCEAAQIHYESALRVFEADGAVIPNIRINLAASLVNCAADQADIDAHTRLIETLLPLKGNWNRDIDPVSWYNVEKIIGAGYRERSVAKYNRAIQLPDGDARQVTLLSGALEDNVIAESYLKSAQGFIRDNYDEITNEYLATDLARTQSDGRSIRSKLRELGQDA